MTTWDSDPYAGAAFGVAKCRRYHAYMREFYRRLHDYSLAITAVSGSAAFVSLIHPDSGTVIAKVATAIVALLTTLDLVFSFSSKADLHDSLCRRFTDLAARMIEMAPTAKNLASVRAQRVRIEADEPTERRLVEIRAHNDECRARGHGPDVLVPLGPLQRSILAFLFPMFGGKGIERRTAKRVARLKASDISSTEV